jgi:hypothetical protein
MVRWAGAGDGWYGVEDVLSKQGDDESDVSG